MKSALVFIVSAIIWLAVMILLAIPMNGIVSVIVMLVGAHCFSMMMVGFGKFVAKEL